MDVKKVLAMAVAAIAQENGVIPAHVIVSSFREIEKSSLEKYIEDNNISFCKYHLEDSKT